MKKYVLNIDRIFGGQTANALVLKQVDEDFPHLLPSLDAHGEHARLTVGEWIQDMQQFHRDFDPRRHVYSVVFTFIPQGQTVKEQSTERHAFLSNLNLNTTMSEASTRRIEHPEERQKTTDATVLDLLKDYIVEFNLMKQDEFKRKGHRELYMMDDSWKRGVRIAEVETEESGKSLMHCLDGIGSESGKFVSQLNPIFPFRKMSNKSLYASQLRIRKPGEMDDYLERARNITLQGKVSYQKCLQEVQCVGSNLYMMSPTVDIGTSDPDSRHIFGNGLTVVNGYGQPYHFPHSMTMFQPSQSEYRESNIEPFIEWCKDHNRKTMVSFKETYGSNTSELKCLGNGSYELELATYSPTDIVLWSEDSSRKTAYRLNSETYRDIRAERDSSNKYRSGKYIFDNGIFDNEKENEYTHVGFMFNLYDTFVTGNDRILHMTVPKNSDYNSLVLKFDWMPVVDGIPGEMEVEITVNEKNVIPQSEDNKFSAGAYEFRQYQLEIGDTATESTDIEIAVRVHYQVDFGRRSQELAYRENLMKSGVVLRDIRIENGVTGSQKWLTFADYVNEDGIDDETRASRLDEFWVVSRYKRDVAYQTVLESPVRNVISSGVAYPNNYSSGDMYGDVFVTKSVLDPRYDMNIRQSPDDENTLIGIARDYIGMGSCSDQLSLLYHPIQMRMGRMGETDVVTTRETPEEYTNLKYQMVEVVKNVNKFESSIKHKSNVFSVVVENSNLSSRGEVDPDDEKQVKIETYKKHLRDSITQFVRDTCQGIVPVHTQLFDVQFT